MFGKNTIKNLVKRKRIICPFCFEQIWLSDTVFRCANEGCKPKRDDILVKQWNDPNKYSTCFAPNRSLMASTFKSSQQTLECCPECSQTTSIRLCNECHKELPHSFGSEEPLMIAIIGEQNSGKSHLMAVLIDELKRRCGNDFGFTLMPLTDATTKRYNDKLYGPLFDHGQVIKPTDPSSFENAERVEPLVYRLQFMAHGGRRGAVATISFFDAPGEDLHADDITSRFSKYVYHSDGLVLLVDTEPLTEGSKRNKRKNTYQALNILERIIRVREKSPQLLSTSIAITLSKLDIMKSQFPPTSALWKNPNHGGTFDYVDFSRTSSEIESKLRELEASDLCNLTRQHFGDDDVGFFGVSALGHQPTGIKVGDINPLRVVEPILWLLSRKGLVPTSQPMDGVK